MAAVADVHAWPRRLVALGLLAAITGSSAPIPLYPIYRAQLDLDAFTMTLIYVMYLVGVLVALFSMSRVLESLRNPYRLLAPALVCSAVGATLMGFALSLPTLMLGRLLAGLGTGSVTVAANSALVELAPGRDPRVAGAISGLAFSAGAGIGPIITGIALQWNLWPMTLPFLLVVAGTLAGLVVPFALWNRIARSHIRRRARGSARNQPAPVPVPWPPVLLCISIIAINWGVGGTLMALGPYFGDLIFNVENYALSGYAISVYMMLAAGSQWLHRRLPMRTAMLRGSVYVVSGAVCVLAATLAKAPIIACLGLYAMATGNGAVFGAAAALINVVAPPEHRARLVSLFFASGYAGSLTPLALGALTDQFGALVTAAGYSTFITSAFVVISMVARRLVHNASRPPDPATTDT